MSLIQYPIVQYAYVVDDLEKACLGWTELTGAGPFFVSPHHVSEDHLYRGAPSEADLSYAFGQAGATHIQLIQQHNDAPSAYRDMFAKGEQGFHHVAILPTHWENEKARFESAGFETVTTLFSASRVAYMDTRSLLGCFVELYEDNEPLRATFDLWKSVADSWDGSDPIRYL